MEGGCWRERGVVSSGDTHRRSWAVVLSPCLLSSCIGIHHCCVLSLPGCPSLLSCSRVSMCWCCVSLLACLCMWLSAHHHMSWLRRHAVFVVMGHSLWSGLLFVSAGLLFVMVIICGFCLVGVICRQVGQDEGGKGGAHRCPRINNDKRQPDVVIRHLLAASVSATWYLVSV